jgi:hypothetical protein
MLQSDGIQSAPILDFEAWGALLRPNCGGEVKVTAPHAARRATYFLPSQKRAVVVASAAAEVGAAIVSKSPSI